MTIGEPEDVTAIVEHLIGSRKSVSEDMRIFVGTTRYHALPAKMRKKVEPAGKALTASILLGRRLGTINVLHRAHPDMDAKLARRLEGQMNAALEPDEAREVILNAVEAHNANCRKG